MALKLGRIRLQAQSAFHRRLVISLGTRRCAHTFTIRALAYMQGARSVHVLGINRKGEAIGMPQELRHPREIDWIGWRKSVSSSYAPLQLRLSHTKRQGRRSHIHHHIRYRLSNILTSPRRSNMVPTRLINRPQGIRETYHTSLWKRKRQG